MAKIALGPFGEPLVSDLRLDKVWVHLSRLTDYPSGLRFATQLQEPIVSPDPGVIKGQEAYAVFMVYSPHPKRGEKDSHGALIYPEDHQLITVGGHPYTQWKEINAEYRHYAGLSDPLRTIFAGLLRQHLAKRKELEELI
jgi:hypothetical protein